MPLKDFLEESLKNREAWKYTRLDALAALEPVQADINASLEAFSGRFSSSSLPLAGRVRVGVGDVSPPLSNSISAFKNPHPNPPRKGEGDYVGAFSGDTQHHLLFINGSLRAQDSTIPASLKIEGEGANLRLAFTGTTPPLELLFLHVPGERPQQAHTSLALSLHEEATATILERHLFLPGATALHTMETTAHLSARATLSHGKIVALTSNAAHLSKKCARLDEGAVYDHDALVWGDGFARHALDIDLAAPHTKAVLRGLMLLSGAAHADMNALIRHTNPHGQSEQKIKAVLKDKARGIFQGKVAVAPHAQKTQAHQNSRALLLSPLAEMIAKPELEILADDVICSHGCAIGDLDEDALFYLRARGIPNDEAHALLIAAFIEDLLSSISAPLVRDAMETEIQGWLA